MTMNGPSLIAFSAACLVAAGLLGQKGGGPSITMDVSERIAARDCMDEGFVIPQGRIGCITPVIAPLVDGRVTTTYHKSEGALKF